MDFPLPADMILSKRQHAKNETALKIELARTPADRVCSTIDNDPESGDVKVLASMAN